MFVRLGDDLVVRPLDGFEGEGSIEFETAGLDGNGLVSTWQFCLQSGLTWARLNCDFGRNDVEIEGNEDRGLH